MADDIILSKVAIIDAASRASAKNTPATSRMTRMVGFRNVAVHDYRKLDLQIVKSIVTTHLDDFLAFGRTALHIAHPPSGDRD